MVMMIWNLVVKKYENFHLHHFLLMFLLFIYSIFGAFVFCKLEAQHETDIIEQSHRDRIRKSTEARKKFIETVEHKYYEDVNFTHFLSNQLKSVLENYDKAMGFNASKPTKKWDLWGGLYYAGTLYTTIGYGDLAPETTAGRVFTMFYAIIGIPMVISILNDWGTVLFKVMEAIWSKRLKKLRPITLLKKLCKWRRYRKGSQAEELHPSMELECVVEDDEERMPGDPQAVPLTAVLILLLFWFALCAFSFSFFTNWTVFESIYFFFISLTTIGLGDYTPTPKVAVINFLQILIGLSVVSMSINVVQVQLELIFARIIRSIDSDFKNNLLEGGDKESKAASTTDVTADALQQRGDAVNQYGKDMSGTEKLLLRFMSNHQKKMLNEKFDERSRMRNKATQTFQSLRVASVQTIDKKHLEFLPEFAEEETAKPGKSGITSRRLYIYNTGD